MTPRGNTAEISAPLQRAQKRIKLREQSQEIAEEIQSAFGLSSIAAQVLAARGYQANSDLKNFLRPTLREGLPSPSSLKNLQPACKLIAETIESGGAIAICCDFDVDGLSGGSQVHNFFQQIGVKSEVFVPDRFVDGYGLNEEMIRTAADKGYALLITIDYGTTNHRELELARELGLKTIVIDHHHVADAGPPADVFVNPQQSDCGFADGILCAAGLAWYLLVGLRRELSQADAIDPKNFLDLACLGTICDMVPLTGANRIIAKRGLELLTQTERKGLRSLKRVIGLNKSVSCSNVSFGIGPRLNAAGRMVHGEMVIDLLTTRDSKKADRLARKLNKLNLERQETEEQVKQRAIELVSERGSLPAGLVVWDDQFHTGVIGIVAQRLVENFYRPSVVMGRDGDIYKGSVRGIKGVSVVELLEGASAHLIKFGGHEGAGGFSVELSKVEQFAESFILQCEQRLKGRNLEPVAMADTEATLEDLTPALVGELKSFEPFGMGNPTPQVLLKSLQVLDVKILKGQHLKAMLSDGRRYLSCLMWRQASHPALEPGRKVNIVCRPEINNFSGTEEMQAVIQAAEIA